MHAPCSDGPLGVQGHTERGDMTRKWSSQYMHYKEYFGPVVYRTESETLYGALPIRTVFFNNMAASGGAVAVSESTGGRPTKTCR